MSRRRWGVVLSLAFALTLCLAAVPAFAASSAVTIKNFAFQPQSMTVPVGSTITWTNQDSAPHTATASDGSFDTGTIKQGQSMTVTFAKAGTFNYICTIHPFMKGTVTVTAAAQAAAAAPAPAAAPANAAPANAAPAPAAAAPAAAAPATAAVPAQMPATGAGGAPITAILILAGLLALVLLGRAATLGDSAVRNR